jgi:hypothetical protein
MTDSPTIGRARRAARALSKTEGVSHQQALDRVAAQAGHRHWSDMLAVDAATTAGTAPAHVPIDPRTDPSPENVSAWLRRHTPRSKAAAQSDRLAPLAIDPRLVAQAVDHDHGPWDDADVLTCRCPVHADANPSLMLVGRGSEFRARCMAGCPQDQIDGAITAGIAQAAVKALDFMSVNDRRLVYAGAVTGQGGMGGRYTVNGGKGYDLKVLTARLLPEEYPKWDHGGLPGEDGDEA